MDWFKAFHIIAVVTWFAGQFFNPVTGHPGQNRGAWHEASSHPLPFASLMYGHPWP